MKKYERINQYLDKVWKLDESLVQKTTWHDLRGVPQFADIGDRTLKEILKAYKFKKGLLRDQQPTTLKRKIVWSYLEKLHQELPPNEFENLEKRNEKRGKSLFSQYGYLVSQWLGSRARLPKDGGIS